MAEYTGPTSILNLDALRDLWKKRKGTQPTAYDAPKVSGGAQLGGTQPGGLYPGQSTVSGFGGAGAGQYAKGNLFGVGGSITAEEAAALKNNPLFNVQTRTHQSAPYPDAILREQAAINAGYDPNFQPNVAGLSEPGFQAEVASAQRAANQDISPIGGSSYATATNMAGESQTITNFSKSLDRDFISAAFGSLMQPPQEGSAAGGGMGDVRINQPQPGDYGMQFSMYGDKKKKRGLFG